MPKHPKVVSITVGKEKRAPQLPRVIQLPSPPERIAHTIECWQNATSIDLVLRTRQFAPALGLRNRSIIKPVQPITFRERTTEDDENSDDSPE